MVCENPASYDKSTRTYIYLSRRSCQVFRGLCLPRFHFIYFYHIWPSPNVYCHFAGEAEMVKSGQVFTTAIVTESDFMKRAETLIEGKGKGGYLPLEKGSRSLLII